MTAERVLVGRVVRPHGLAGEVVVEVLTDFPERFAPGRTLLVAEASPPRPATISSARWHSGRLLLGLAGATDRDGAERLRGAELLVDETDLAPRPPGFVYHFEVEGCAAVDPSGRPLGTVVRLEEVSGRHLLVLATPRGERDVPFVRPIVVEVDLGGRRVVVDAPAGLID